MGYRGMGHMGNGAQGGNGVQGYRAHGQWGIVGNWVQGVWGTWTMGCRPSNVLECQTMSSCQKDIKCQKFKHLDYGGGSQKQ